METENTCLQRGAVSGIVGTQIVVVLPEEGACLGVVESTCTATVLQYCACITDETSALVQTVNGLPDCATLQTTDIASIMTAEGTSLPASCAKPIDPGELLVILARLVSRQLRESGRADELG
jgi:hypothetical protein